jgi:hypothetical protein
MSAPRVGFVRRRSCVDVADHARRAAADAAGLLAALTANPDAADRDAVGRLAGAHGLVAAGCALGGVALGGELVLLLPAGGAGDAGEHWLLALWRDNHGPLRRAALFACTNYWHAQREDDVEAA